MDFGHPASLIENDNDPFEVDDDLLFNSNETSFHGSMPSMSQFGDGGIDMNMKGDNLCMKSEGSMSYSSAYMESHSPSSSSSFPSASATMIQTPNIPSIDIDDKNSVYMKFMEELNRKIIEKDLKQKEIEAKAKIKAAQELEQFYDERELKHESRQASNRSEEQALMEKLVADLECENSWERVVSLVDVTEKKSSKEKDPTDVDLNLSRMRQIFIQLKNQPLDTTRSVIT